MLQQRALLPRLTRGLTPAEIQFGVGKYEDFTERVKIKRRTNLVMDLIRKRLPITEIFEIRLFLSQTEDLQSESGV